jgi:hypothetical protein
VRNKWCCADFELHATPEAATDGIHIWLIMPSRPPMECYVDFRSEASSNMRYETGLKINFCPWCGANIAKHYSAVPDSSIPSGNVVEMPRPRQPHATRSTMTLFLRDLQGQPENILDVLAIVRHIARTNQQSVSIRIELSPVKCVDCERCSDIFVDPPSLCIPCWFHQTPEVSICATHTD